MFRSALLKLTGLYLLILMAVSIFFSLNLYRISTAEINNRLKRQIDFVYNIPPGAVNELGLRETVIRRSPVEQQLRSELNESKNTILLQLAYANLVILVLGGLGSYFLARRTLEPIEEAHAAQSRFAADASHELRTPLASIRTETEVTLRNPKLTLKEAKHQLHSNLEEMERLSDLSEGLLQLARGSNDVVKEPVLLSEIVTEALHQRETQAKAKKISVVLKKLPRATLLVNPTQLLQTLVILLDNAVKYSPAGASLTIGGKKQHNHVILHVKDTGPGLQPQELNHVFDRFYRADAARSTSNTPGYGLGLAIAKQIIESHDGSLTVSSTPGRGSCFTISLPTK